MINTPHAYASRLECCDHRLNPHPNAAINNGDDVRLFEVFCDNTGLAVSTHKSRGDIYNGFSISEFENKVIYNLAKECQDDVTKAKIDAENSVRMDWATRHNCLPAELEQNLQGNDLDNFNDEVVDKVKIARKNAEQAANKKSVLMLSMLPSLLKNPPDYTKGI